MNPHDSSASPTDAGSLPPPNHGPTTSRETPPPKRWLRWAGFLLALAGWSISVDLYRLSVGASAVNPLLDAACGGRAGAASDCQSVLHSEAAQLGGGLDRQGRPRSGTPWAVMGLGYFALPAAWFLFIGPPTRSRWFVLLPMALVVLIGTWASVSLLAVMAFELKRWCIGCTIAHVLNFGLLLVTLASFPWTPRSARATPYPPVPLAGAALLAGAGLFFANQGIALLNIVSNNSNQLRTRLDEIESDSDFARLHYRRQTAVEIPLREDEAFVGSADAQHTVVAFIDFQCPACRRASELLSQVVEKNPDKLRVAYRHFPLDPACNPAREQQTHPAACRAAWASEAARQVGGPAAFLAMRKRLYQGQADLDANPFATWAAEIGLNPAAFETALSSAAAQERVREDIELGRKLGVEGAPVLYLDGRRVEHWFSEKTWEALLAE